MTIRTFLDFLWFQVCVSQSFSASWVRRPSAASVVTITFRRSKKQAWRLDVHAHTGLYNLHLCLNQMSQWSMDTRELSSALRTHCCVRFCYFGSAELSRPYWLSSSFFAFELRLRRLEGARFNYITQRASHLSMSPFQVVAPVAQLTETIRPPTSEGSRIFPVRTEASAFLASRA